MELVGKGGEFNGAHFPFDNVITIGRDINRSQVCFSQASRGISGLHCKVERRPDGLYLTDMGSTNGTFLENGTKLTPNVAMRLEPGQGFYLGSMINFFCVNDNGGSYVNNAVVPEQNIAQPQNVQGDEITEPVVSIGKWIILRIVLSIPLVGLVMWFVWLLSDSTPKSKKNFLISDLLYHLIMTAISFLGWLLVMAIAGASLAPLFF